MARAIVTHSMRYGELYMFDLEVAAPEPGSLALLGLAVLVYARRRLASAQIAGA